MKHPDPTRAFDALLKDITERASGKPGGHFNALHAAVVAVKERK